MTWFYEARSLAYPIILESEISEQREAGKEFDDVTIFERVRKTQGE